MLLGCALSPDGKTLALTNAGYGPHHLLIADAQSGTIRQRLPVPRAWNGVAWSPDSQTVWVAGGASRSVHRFVRGDNGMFAPSVPLTPTGIPENAYQAGIAVSPDGKTLYLADCASDAVYAINLPEGTVRTTARLEAGTRPYCLRLAPENDGRVYVGPWGRVEVVTLSADSLKITDTFAVGSHPNDLLWDQTGTRLFVSCGNDDSVYVLNGMSGAVIERISVGITPRAPQGAVPSALALSPDGTRLYVACSGVNAVAAVDIRTPARSRILGFLPTGWYPTLIQASPDGKRLFMGTGKGLGTRPSRPHGGGSNAVELGQSGAAGAATVTPRGFQYIPRMLEGMLSTLPTPDEAALAAYTRQVRANSPYDDALLDRPHRAPKPKTNPIPSRVGDASPIKYVVYIIKENRTYDQILGDMTDAKGKRIGNGDPKLTLFGEEVTPNHHALAREYVLLDNLFASGEVSGNGHPWSTGAYETDFTARTWPVQYSRKGVAPRTEEILRPPAGYLWDLCEQAGHDYVSYYDPARKRLSASFEAAKVRAKGDAITEGRPRDPVIADTFIADLGD